MAKLSKAYDPKVSEPRWRKFWDDEGIYKFDFKSGSDVYSIDTPPPTVSGAMHMGHAFSYAQQDFVARYQRMRGKNIFYPWGFDDNGLATERFVERRLKIKARDVPRRDFVKLCLKETKDAERELRERWSALGISPDWSIDYRTIDDWCTKTSQLSFIELYNKGREYQKEAPTIWCPECGTAIAQVELEDKELSSKFNDIVFKLKREDGSEESLIIATTRPELLPSCVSIFVHPDDERYREIVGKTAKVPLFDYEVPIIADERADPEKGTGMVMCCTFGDLTDIEWWKAHNLPLNISITETGIMNDKAGKYKGLKIKEARKQIIEDLKSAGLLVGQKDISHMVNVHERCGTSIEFLVTKQWFIRYLDLKDRFLEAGREIKWYPDYMRIRYENWIKGLQWDWCISRQRFYGVPFPVWYCKKCGEVSIADEKDLPVDPLHDMPKKPCKCGSNEFVPEKDILDTWATSSLTPEIALKWRKDDEFFKKMFPMNLRPQAHDIITFWAFNTVVKAILHEDSIPWKDIMISGHALDPKGRKMSKSKGNVVDPMDMIGKYSADALRFWAAGSKLGEDLSFNEKDLLTGQKFMTKLWNASRFVFMHLEDFDPEKSKGVKLTTIDKWLLAKLDRIVKGSTEFFDNYEYMRTKLDTEKFFWMTFCDYYLEMVKHRLYRPETYGEESRKAAQFTLYHALLTIVKLIAPIMPYITEEVYQAHYKKTEKTKSIHVSEWPEIDESLVDEISEKAGDLAVNVITEIRKYKSENNIALRDELGSVEIEVNKDLVGDLEKVTEDIRGTGKVKYLKIVPSDVEGYELKISK